jgi:hypothetical protein
MGTVMARMPARNGRLQSPGVPEDATRARRPMPVLRARRRRSEFRRPGLRPRETRERQGEGRGCGGGAPDPTGGQGRGRGGTTPFAAACPPVMPMPMQNFDVGNHPPIPPVGMPPFPQTSMSAPTAFQHAPMPAPAPVPAPAPTLVPMDAPMVPMNAHIQASAMNAPMAPVNAPTQAIAMNAPPAMHQCAPAPQPAPTMDEFTAQQWKAASACHEY